MQAQKKEENIEEEDYGYDSDEEDFSKYPWPEKWILPRLFLINNDNTSVEFLSEEQLRLFF